MDAEQNSPLFNIVYYRETDLVARKIEVDDPEGHFFTTTARPAPVDENRVGRQRQYMIPRPDDPTPTHPLMQCSACKHVFFPDKFYSHACGKKALEPPEAPRVRGIVASSVVLHKNDLMDMPEIGAPLYCDDAQGKTIKLEGVLCDCIGIYAGAGPMINNQNGGVDRSILVLLQQ